MPTSLVRGFAAILCLSALAVLDARRAGPRVEIVRKDADRRIDVLIGGQPFTSYIWPTTVKKPVLFPIRSAGGTLVTRGYPLEPRAGERMDHPHHVGLWFNYGEVNAIDFWGNSDAIPAADRGKVGTIVQRAIVSAEGGDGEGHLTADSDWVMPDGSTVLADRTTYTFRGDATTRTIDLDITLTAKDKPVVFTDTKEGMLGLRVARPLEAPSTEPEVFTDAAGHPTTVPSMDNTGVNGVYLTSEGTKGDAVWGTRGKWCLLSGRIGKEAVGIAILDHPSNPGYPTYWHARGYGLFAANPLGVKTFTNGKTTLTFTIAAKQSARFRYRIVVLTGTPTAADVEKASAAWAAVK